jgi:hypothetical protein
MLRMLYPGRGSAILLLTLALTSGCEGPPPSASVSGYVTYGGKPFEGRIVFTPGGSSTERKTVEASIQGGRYEIPSISPGTKTITIFSSAPATDPKHNPAHQNGFWVANPRTVEVKTEDQSIDFTVTRLAP